jgi:hypothetical protein
VPEYSEPEQVQVEAPKPFETAQPPKELIEIKAYSGMSEAENKKLEELRNMKR